MAKKKDKNEPEPAKTRNILVATLLILGGLYLLSVVFSMMVGTDGNVFEGNVAVVSVHGLITPGDEAFGQSVSVNDWLELLDEAAEDPQVQAVVLDINSPGGAPVASAELAQAVRSLDKPTVAWIRDLGASGAYWAASAADHVVAHELSMTGSIGVLGSYLEFSQFLDDYNVSYQRLVAGEYKDAGSPLKELEPKERTMLENQLDKMHGIFIEAVAENRNLSVDAVRRVADGRLLLGGEALEAGLVDELGGEDEVRAYLEGRLNASVAMDELRKERSLVDVLRGVVSDHGYAVGEGLSNGLRPDEWEVRV
ncbi:MAG: signal peptide peptidase SppA [Candidatus Woesearchaeota archaeon]